MSRSCGCVDNVNVRVFWSICMSLPKCLWLRLYCKKMARSAADAAMFSHARANSWIPISGLMDYNAPGSSLCVLHAYDYKQQARSAADAAT